MVVLKSASIQDLKRLLELFPIAKLKETWPEVKGRKEELSNAVAKQRHRNEVVRFVDDNFSCCKQHVYVFLYVKPLKELPDVTIGAGDRVSSVKGQHALYLTRLKYSVLLDQPLEQSTLEFLWPFRLEFMRGHLLVRFVVMEKNVGSYFGGRPAYIKSHSVDEESVLQEVAGSFDGGLQSVDLHKGIKKLWADGFMDATRTRYKKPMSTASEAMDEERGIREYNPELYEMLRRSTLFNTMFRVKQEKGASVSAFLADCSRGFLAFPRYSDRRGDTDDVVDEILRNN